MRGKKVKLEWGRVKGRIGVKGAEGKGREMDLGGDSGKGWRV